MSEELRIKGIVLSDEGLKRTTNEDNFCLFGIYREDLDKNKSNIAASSTTNMEYVAVYDGMGGETAGEIASLIAAKSITPCEFDKIRSEGLNQIMVVNRVICDEAEKKARGRIGTTMVGVYFDQGKAVCCNVGDSRAYLFRSGELTQLSKDHSEGQRMIDGGFLTLEEAKKSKTWHQLTQNLGVFEDEFVIEPFYGETIDIQKGDIFLLCSDGLTDDVADQEIGDILSSRYWLRTKASRLLKLAMDRGGRDNTTVMLVEVRSNKFFDR